MGGVEYPFGPEYERTLVQFTHPTPRPMNTACLQVVLASKQAFISAAIVDVNELRPLTSDYTEGKLSSLKKLSQWVDKQAVLAITNMDELPSAEVNATIVTALKMLGDPKVWPGWLIAAPFTVADIHKYTPWKNRVTLAAELVENVGVEAPHARSWE